ITMEASFRAREAFISPSAAITCRKNILRSVNTGFSIYSRLSFDPQRLVHPRPYSLHRSCICLHSVRASKGDIHS
uniref:Uncharacterized protein n=1 Tax=Leptobrachium leishanense TaxID=445787 RepID=A0A8C5R8M5_9ANUR